jgi:hypothetical protein
MKENKQAEKPERKGEKEQTVVKADTKKNHIIQWQSQPIDRK